MKESLIVSYKRVLYGIVCMIKIESSTVSLQDKTMYFIHPFFFWVIPSLFLSHSLFFSSFPRRRESHSVDSQVSGGHRIFSATNRGLPPSRERRGQQITNQYLKTLTLDKQLLIALTVGKNWFSILFHIEPYFLVQT